MCSRFDSDHSSDSSDSSDQETIMVRTWAGRLVTRVLEEEGMLQGESWSPRAGAREEYQMVWEVKEQRRTSSSQSPTPGVSWSWLSCSGTRSSPGSRSASGCWRTLLAQRWINIASHCTSSPAHWVVVLWREFLVSCLLYVFLGYIAEEDQQAETLNLKHYNLRFIALEVRDHFNDDGCNYFVNDSLILTEQWW